LQDKGEIEIDPAVEASERGLIFGDGHGNHQSMMNSSSIDFVIARSISDEAIQSGFAASGLLRMRSQ